MKLSKGRIAWLRKVLETAEYCHVGTWGGKDTWDVQGDLEDALDDIARLEAEIERLLQLIASAHLKALAIVGGE